MTSRRGAVAVRWPVSRSRQCHHRSRWHALQGGAALGLAAAAGSASAAATKKFGGKIIPLACTDPLWNRETRARIEVFYGDLETGEMMDSWDNVLTGEKVRVGDIANDPFNYVISEFFGDPPSERARPGHGCPGC